MVFDDFDVDQAVNYAAFGAFIGAGQTCVCGSRQIVQASIYDEFVEKLAAKTRSRSASAIRSIPPCSSARSISARQRERVLGYVALSARGDARAGRGRPVPRRCRARENGFFVEPTVFADVTPRHAHLPGGGVRAVHLGHAASRTRPKRFALANDSPFGLAGPSAPATSRARTGSRPPQGRHRLDQRPPPPRPGLALGRRGRQSGIGRECGTESFDDHFDTKSVMVATGDGPFDWYRDTAGQPRLN